VSTDRQKKLGLAIVGGGKGGLAFLQLFHQAKDIEILGIADIRPEAPAIKYAQSIGVPTTNDFRQLIKGDQVVLIVREKDPQDVTGNPDARVQIILDVTGNPDVRAQIVKEKDPQVEVLGGITAKLMWNFIENLERKVEGRTQELKETQAKLLQSEKLASMGQVSASVGHELRNPLSVIKNSTYYLKMKIKEDPKLVKHLDILDRQVIAAEKIIDDLLTFTRISELSATLTDIHQTIDDVLSITDVPSGVLIEKNFDPQLLPFQVDSDQIRRVFINLIQNAFQAMNNGGTLKVTTRQKDGWSEIEFSDTGHGIVPENLEKLFQPFFTTRAKGIGLGLAVSKKIIDQHKGKIQINSDLGKGTTFTISLPTEI